MSIISIEKDQMQLSDDLNKSNEKFLIWLRYLFNSILSWLNQMTCLLKLV